MIKPKLCPICVLVSLTWLALSAGIAWGIIDGEKYLMLISLLMGGTVVGIAFVWDKSRQSMIIKSMVVVVGMAVAYLFATNISKTVVIVEALLLTLIAYSIFGTLQPRLGSAEEEDKSEDRLSNCC